MTSKRLLLPLLVALMLWGNLNSVHASSGSSSSWHSTSQVSLTWMGNKRDTPVSRVTVDEAGARKNPVAAAQRHPTRLRDPPGSPVKLFMPDEFQFYTLNGHGQLVMKQMSKEEIQGMLAASVGGGSIADDVGISLINPEQHQQIQLTDGVPKVADVVQNVQKVLKSQLNKPAPVRPLSSSIPGSVNSQWTNMLPYILSGGSADQPDASQDASIVLSASDADNSYANVLPSHVGKPTGDQYRPGPNYVQIQTASDPENLKLSSHKPTVNTSEKPIYLLGNMALDSDILGAQETYVLPAKDKPNRPTLTSTPEKLTTKPFVSKDTATNVRQNSTNGKPTLYIPLSVSSSLQESSQSHYNHSQIDSSVNVPSSLANPEKNFTLLSNGEAETTSFGASTKQSTSHVYSNESEVTRAPTIQLPVTLPDKMKGPTQTINDKQQQTSSFETLPTISPQYELSTMEEESLATKPNEEHTGSIKKPGVIYEPSTSHHAPYDIPTKLSTISFMPASSYDPLQASTIMDNLSKDSSTHRPIYQPITKINTIKYKQSTQRPTHETETKPSVTKNQASTSLHDLLNEVETQPSTIKSAPIKSTTLSKITQPSNPPDVTTEPNTANPIFNATKYPTNTQETKVVPMLQQSSTKSDLSKSTEHPEINYNDYSKTSSYYNQAETTTNSISSDIIDNYGYTTDAFTDSAEKLKEEIMESSTSNKVNYETEMSSGSETKHKMPTTNDSGITSAISSSQEQTIKTDVHNKYEEAPDVQTLTQESKTENNYNYYAIAVDKDTTKSPEQIYTEADNTPVAVTETALFYLHSASESNVGELKNQYEPFLPVSTDKLPEHGEITRFKDGDRYNGTDGSLNIHKNANDNVNKSDKIPTWINNEVTTQFIPMDEATTEYYENKYDFNETKRPISNTYNELSSDKESQSSATAFKETYTTDRSNADSTAMDYSTLINKDYYPEQSLANDESKNSANTLMDNNTSQYHYYSTNNADNKVTTPTYISNYETQTTTYDKQTTATYIANNQNTDPNNINIYTKSSYEVTELPITEFNKLSQTVKSENENTIIGVSNLTETTAKTVDNSNTKSTIQLSTFLPDTTTSTSENNPNQFNSLDIESSTSINEKLAIIITEEAAIAEKNNSPTKFTTKIVSDYDKKPILLQEDEVSTIRVIPVYDDDMTSLYSLPSNNLNQAMSTINANNIKSSESAENVVNTTKLSPSPSSDIIQLLKPTNQQQQQQQQYKPLDQQEYKPTNQINQPLDPIIAPKLNHTTQNTPTYNTILPNLRETFDNYTKDHYDTKLPTTDSYNESSDSTTIPTDIDPNPSNRTNKLPTLTTSNHLKLNVQKHPTSVPLDQKLQLNTNPTTEVSKYSNAESVDESQSTVTYNLETLGNADSVTKSTLSKEIYSTEYVDDNSQTLTTKSLGISSNDSVETPIIYLDLKDSDSNKQGTSHQSSDNNDHGSLFTRITINKPVIDAEKIVAEAPVQTNTPSLVHYTLSNYYKEPNDIASGLIAGYPTYDHLQPPTQPPAQYLTDTPHPTTSYDNAPVTGTPVTTTNNHPPYITSDEQNDRNVSYQEEQSTTLLLLENDKNYKDRTSSIPIYISEGEGASTYGYEPDTSLPSESIPMSSKTKIPSQTPDKHDSSLEKISDLISQLQDKTLEPEWNEYSVGVATTDSPLDRLDESNSTPPGNTYTTILDKSNETPVKSPISTHSMHQQTRPPPSNPPRNSSELAGQFITTKQHTTLEASTPGNFKAEAYSASTTTVTTERQPLTAKPHPAISTYSATKGSTEKIQSTIDKSAGRINLEEEKNKMQTTRLTELPKFTVKNKVYHSNDRRPTNEGSQSYVKKTTKPVNKSAGLVKEQTTSRPPTGITKDMNADKWTLVPQRNDVKESPMSGKEGAQKLNPQIVTLDHASGAIGLDQSNKALDKDVAEFLNMCNELSFKFWALANSELSSSRSLTLSPFGMISTLAMIFLGARGLTSNQMNDILKLDDVVTFNPHLVFQNITDTVTLARGQGIQNAAFVRALFADRLKVRKIMPFYKEQAQQFYEGAVVDINFSTAGDILRRRTNLLIRKQTGGRIKDFVKGHTVPLRSPLTALSANVFQTSCDSPDASSEGRDGEMYFAVSQTVKQRKLVPIPAVLWKSGVSAGYEPSLDATAVALGDAKRPVSLIMVMPGQQGLTAAGDNLERLEHRLFSNPSDNALEKLLKVIVPRRVDVQIPRFSHRSIVNITSALKKLGFDQLFTKTADLKGINGAGHDLYLADMLQMNLFNTCGDENKLGGRPLSETFPGTSTRHTRAWEIINNIKAGADDLEIEEWDAAEIKESNEDREEEEQDCQDSLALGNISGPNEESPEEGVHSPIAESGKRDESDKSNALRQKQQQRKNLWWLAPIKSRRCRNRRQVEVEKPRMKMDKPFLYLIRHNLTGLILHIGRFNPRNQS